MLLLLEIVWMVSDMHVHLDDGVLSDTDLVAGDSTTLRDSTFLHHVVESGGGVMVTDGEVHQTLCMFNGAYGQSL